MSNPLLLSSYGSPNDFIIDGKRRGFHALRPQGHGIFRYEAEVEFNGRLPKTRLVTAAFVIGENAGALYENTASAYVAARESERAQFVSAPQNPPRVSAPAIPRGVWAFSAGKGFVERLLDGHERRFDEAAGAGIDLNVDVRDGGRAFLKVILGPTSNDVALAEWGSHIATALAYNVDRIIGSGEVFADTRATLVGLEDDGEPTPERLESLAAHVTDSANWLSATADRLDDHLLIRLQYDEDGLNLQGNLKVAWRDAAISVVDVVLDAVVPDTEGGTLSLTPQKGLLGALMRPFEHQVGDPALDDQFLIRGDRDFALKWARLLTDRLLFLSMSEMEFLLQNDKLLITSRGVPFTAARLSEHLDAMLNLWRTVARKRAGLSGHVDVYA